MPRAAQPKSAVKFSQEIFDRICALIADGKSVREACGGKGMPDRGTFNDWRKRTPELQAQYDQARVDREESYFDDIVHIADTVKDPKVAKVRMEAREWCLARMNGKKYGPRVMQEVSGPNGGPLQQVVRLKMMPVEELPE